jgi:hypothetical protein
MLSLYPLERMNVVSLQSRRGGKDKLEPHIVLKDFNPFDAGRILMIYRKPHCFSFIQLFVWN